MKSVKKSVKKNEELLHWADEKEVISSNRPLLFVFSLMRLLPNFVVFILIYPISFFYFVFSKRGRTECRLYQNQLKTFTGGKIPEKISPFRQILSFTLCVMEKMEGWLGNYHYDELVLHDDDLKELQNRLEEKKGALLIGSHLGNIELLRSLSSFGENGIKREVPVMTIMELKSTEQFNRTLQEVNPNVGFRVVDPSSIGPETIIEFQEQIENGGLVVITGDRTSARSRNRIIRKKFLGKDADFPYGVFVMALLLKAPIYYLFGLRTKNAALNPKYNIFVEKSEVDLNCPREKREEKLDELCGEFVGKLEKYCAKFPYQWYNFYNFWKLNEEFAK